MPPTPVALRLPAFRALSARILIVVLVALAALLFFEWRSARRNVAGASDADTMCVAARIGLSCRS